MEGRGAVSTEHLHRPAGQRLETLAMLVLLLLSVEGTNGWEGMRPKALLAPGLAPYFDF